MRDERSACQQQRGRAGIPAQAARRTDEILGPRNLAGATRYGAFGTLTRHDPPLPSSGGALFFGQRFIPNKIRSICNFVLELVSPSTLQFCTRVFRVRLGGCNEKIAGCASRRHGSVLNSVFCRQSGGCVGRLRQERSPQRPRAMRFRRSKSGLVRKKDGPSGRSDAQRNDALHEVRPKLYAGPLLPASTSRAA